MLVYGARAVPWLRVALAACLVVVLVELVRWNPWVLWPLEGTAVGLLAGATAWCFDETAAAVVDVAPRSLAWRTAVRSSAVLLLGVVWTGVVLHAGEATLFGHPRAIWWQGVGAMVAGAAVSCWRRARGEAVPGLLFATAVVPAATAWALVRPLSEQVAVFPYGTTSTRGWNLSSAGWAAAVVLGAALLVLALGDAPWWHRRSRVR